MLETRRVENGMASPVLRRGHGLVVDHIGLGVPNTAAGVAWLEDKVGAKCWMSEAEPGQWYWSGALSIGADSFLEVIGPNPAWPKFQPFRAMLTKLRAPRLLFWYVAVNDFDAYAARAAAAGAPMERVERIGPSAAHGADYTRGNLGPGFITQRPNVIEWRSRPPRMDLDRSCRLIDFRLSHPQAPKLRAVFAALDIDVPVIEAPSSIGLTLETPKGRVDLDNPGMDWVGLGALVKIARLWLTSR